MRRSISFAFMCLALMAFGIWQTLGILSPPESEFDFGWYHFIPVVIGCLSIGVAGYWCLRPPGFIGLKNYLPMLGPFACLLFVLEGAILGSIGFEKAMYAPTTPHIVPAPFVAGSVYIRAQAIGYYWAALALFASTILATASRRTKAGDDKSKIPWIWVGVGLVGALDIFLIRSPWWNTWGRMIEFHPWSRMSLVLDNHLSLLSVDAWPAAGGLFLVLIVVAVLPILLRRLTRQGLDFQNEAVEGISWKIVAAPQGVLFGCLCLGQALSKRASADVLWSLHHLLVEKEMTREYWSFHESSLALTWLGQFPSVAVSVLGFVVFGLFIFHVRRVLVKHFRLAAISGGAILAVLLGIEGANHSLKSNFKLEPCNCVVGDLIGELVSGGLDCKEQYDSHYELSRETQTFILPTLDTGTPPNNWFHEKVPFVMVWGAKVVIYGLSHVELENDEIDTGVIADAPTGEKIEPLLKILEGRRKDLRMKYETSEGMPEVKEVLFAVSPETPQSFVHRLRTIALDAGLKDHFFMVRASSKCSGACREIRVVKAPPLDEDHELSQEADYEEVLSSWI